MPEGPQQNAVYYDWFTERLGEVTAPSHLESAIGMDAMKLMGTMLAVYVCGAESIKWLLGIPVCPVTVKVPECFLMLFT